MIAPRSQVFGSQPIKDREHRWTGSIPLSPVYIPGSPKLIISQLQQLFRCFQNRSTAWVKRPVEVLNIERIVLELLP